MAEQRNPNKQILICPRSVGAPLKYDPKLCDKMVQAAAQGKGTHAQLMVEIGIKSHSTFLRWQKEYPEFKEAVEYADLVFQAWCEDVQLRGILGELQGYNDKAMSRLLAAKFEEYKKAAQPSSTTEINIGSINSVNALPNDEVQRRIEQLQKKLGLTKGITIDADSTNE